MKNIRYCVTLEVAWDSNSARSILREFKLLRGATSLRVLASPYLRGLHDHIVSTAVQKPMPVDWLTGT